MRDVLPPPVYGAIEAHLTERGTRATEGWEAGEDEEDTLAGHLGATFQTPREVAVANGSFWEWRIRYKKFRGRGPGAFEHESGADGIFQLEVTRESRLQFKGLLFQAKKVGQLNGSLGEQVKRMEEMAPRSSAVFEYGPESYRAISGADYLSEQDVQGLT